MTDTFHHLPMNQLSPFGTPNDDDTSFLSPFAKNETKKQKKQPYVSPSMQGYQQKMKLAQSFTQGGICYGSGQTVGRLPLKQLLLTSAQNTNDKNLCLMDAIIPIKFHVPIFQRRYCWTETQWQTLLMDAATATTSSDDFHSLGRLTCTNLSTLPIRPEQQQQQEEKVDDTRNKASGRSIILDGQQRFTTVTLLLAAIRDALWKRQQRFMEKNLPFLENPTQIMDEIDQILFPDQEDYQQWLNTSPKLEEGIELNFAKLIPTYCDRWSYYSAILPKHLQISNRLMVQDNDTAFRRPLVAKDYYDAVLCTFSNGELLNLLDGIYHKLTMLLFPMEFATGRDDATQDPMVVYERLAIRDATFCTPRRSDEHVTMSGLDMIRNAMLGTFEQEADAMKFYQSYWLPMEQMAATFVGDKNTGTTVVDDDHHQDHPQQEEDRNNMQSMMRAFLDQESLDHEEEKLEEGTVGGLLYVRFQLWQDRYSATFTTTESSSSLEAEQATRQQGETILAFAKGYFQS